MQDREGDKATISLFGGFAIAAPNGLPVTISSKKAQGLIAYLALAPGCSATRDKLVGVLWSDRDDEHARNSLRQVLTGLRRDLAPIGFDILVTERDQLALNAYRISVDVKEFEDQAGSATAVELEAAIRLYRGGLLDGVFAKDDVFEQWASNQRSRLLEHAIAAGERLVACSAPGKRVAHARALLGLDQSRESSHRALMKALADNGERDLALRQHEICREILARELSTRPSAEMERLRTAIASGDGQAHSTGPVPQERTPVVAAKPVSQPSEGIPSIAVLPFANLSGDREQDYFADGLTNDVINALCRFRRLHVIARNSSFRYRGQDVDVRQVGRELDVQYVLEGSVRRSGNRIRVTAELIEAATRTQVWASRYDRDVEDLLLVQDETARAIVSTFGKVVETSEWHKASRLSPDGLKAHELYHRASNFWTDPTREQIAASCEQLSQAIDLDPTNPDAHAKLANMLYVQWEFWWVADRPGTLQTAYDLATKAVRLDERNSHCRWVLGLVQLGRGEPEQARLNLEKAIELNPNDARGRVLYGWYLSAMGQHDRAIHEIDLARRYDPLEEDWVPWVRGTALFAAQRYEDAIAALCEINDPFNEARGYLAASLAQAGRIAEAKSMLQKFLDVARHEMAIYPGDRIRDWEEFWRDATQYQEDDFARFCEGLRKAGMPD